ncbi:MAG: cupin domain-containing protein [Acidobacteriota bacterium]|nr:cupin domain-containing protein [Acidobacteriota bacterium]
MTKTGFRIWTLSLIVLVTMAASALAQAADSKMTAKAKGREIIWPAGDYKWVDAPNAPPGVKQVVLWGDPTKGGRFGAIQKFPAGFSAPLHTHSAGLHMVIMSGTVIHIPEGKPEVRLPANSYLYDPPGYRHSTKCDAASECVFFLEGDGKFDVKMVEKK